MASIPEGNRKHEDAVKTDVSSSYSKKRKRNLCDRCHRVRPKACLCHALPEQVMELKDTKVVILQHPHEFKHKTNRSVPLLELCLGPLHLCVGRRLGDNIPSDIQSLLQPPNLPILIFPPLPENNSSTKVYSMTEIQSKIAEWRSDEHDEEAAGCDEKESATPKIVLLVLDATWKYAKEMHRANAYFYPKHMLQMALQGDGDLPTNFRPRRFEIRTTPQAEESWAWMSTAECVAWILSKLEERPEIYEKMIQVIDAAVQQYHTFITEGKQHRKGSKSDTVTD